MSPRDEMLACISKRTEENVPYGEPIIPEGPVATSDDMQEFKRLAEAMGYEVKFGQSRAVTKPGARTVAVTPSCTVGVLSDEFLHVWNNFADGRGQHLENGADKAEHRALGGTLRLSGSSNDRRFHQLELRNFVRHLKSSGGSIPTFMWRTFSGMKRAQKA
ncbi:MAG TPA: hypothetical protein VGL53_13580 [Bryobacteraceae bacterium]|jgi:hypothetical protein